MPATRPSAGSPPHTFILKLLNFRDRDLVLREARKIDVLRYEATKLMIFPDYSVDTQHQRRSFDHDGETVQFFTSPEDASHWLDSLSRA